MKKRQHLFIAPHHCAIWLMAEAVERKYLDIKFNLDERTRDGYYYASAIKYFLRILRHPGILDNPPE